MSIVVSVSGAKVSLWYYTVERLARMVIADFVKVIATNRQIDLRPLAIPPETGIRSRFPVDCGPLYDLIADALHGGFAQSRGDLTRELLPETWAAKSVFVDVER